MGENAYWDFVAELGNETNRRMQRPPIAAKISQKFRMQAFELWWI